MPKIKRILTTSFLILAILLFLSSLTLSIWVSFQFWQKTKNSTAITTDIDNTKKPSNKDNSNLLLPKLTIDSELEKEDLIKKLFKPMRLYYATKPERLSSVSIEKIEDEKHSTRVTFDLIINNKSNTQAFYFDCDNDNSYPTWEPSMLDINE